MAEVASLRVLTAQARVRSHDSPYTIYDNRSIGTSYFHEVVRNLFVS